MFNIGGGEVLVILLIALIVLGPDKLPNAARQAGKYLGDFRRMSSGFQRELRDAMDLGDLGDLVSGKPQSAGGPTAQPGTASEPTITPSTDAAPIDLSTTPDDAPSPNGTGDAALSGTATNGTATNGTATNGTATNGIATNGSTPATNGSTSPAADGEPAAAVRKRSIEVDGPSSSFD